MRKRNIIVFAVLACVLVVLVILLLQQGNKLPFLGADFAESQQEGKPALQPLDNNGSAKDIEAERGWNKGLTPVAQQSETVLNDNQSVTVFHASVSKQLNNLSKIDASSYITRYPVNIDEEGTFLDDNLYVEVGVKIKNNEEASKELCLPNILLISTFEGDDFALSEMTMTNMSVEYSKSMFNVTLAPGEEKTYYLGYIITQDDYQKYGNDLCLLPDFCGVFTMDRDLLCKIKLNVEEIL